MSKLPYSKSEAPAEVILCYFHQFFLKGRFQATQNRLYLFKSFPNLLDAIFLLMIHLSKKYQAGLSSGHSGQKTLKKLFGSFSPS